MNEYEFDAEYRRLLERLDSITSEIYTLGATEERASLMSHFLSLIHEKDMDNDQIAVNVLNWALERMSVAN